jgi:hypothetical protein
MATQEPWQDFGQKIDLTARIREILLNYPEGTAILKELIQVRSPGSSPRSTTALHACSI